MLKVLIKKKAKANYVILVIVLFALVHLSGKLLLGADFTDSVLNYYKLEYRNFYVVVKHLLPIVTFLYLFVFNIDLSEDYLILVIIRNRNKYKHIIDISLFIILMGVIYWGLYFLMFYFISGTSHFIAGREVIRMVMIISQTSSLCFCLSRVIKHLQIASQISCIFLVFLSFQSQYIVDLITLSPIAVLIVVVNLFLIVIYISKVGVLSL
ncbi:lantibiotic ABC transporter permease [Streptococcus phocae subsp. phocae]